jgi:hypothetical protein
MRHARKENGKKEEKITSSKPKESRKLYGKYNRDIIKAKRQYAKPSATEQNKQTNKQKNQSSNAAWSLIY